METLASLHVVMGSITLIVTIEVSAGLDTGGRIVE
jgi:hypothetical protein